MSFLNPAGLWGLLGIPVLILIYIIKPKFQERPVTSTFIWKLARKYKKKTLPWQISNLLLFFVQLLVIGAVSLILARPVVITQDGAAEKVVILDASASMMVEEKDGIRFEKAKKQIMELADKMEDHGKMTVILAGSESRVLIERSDSEQWIKAMVESADCSYGEENLNEALLHAEQILRQNPGAAVYLFTDKEHEDAGSIQVVNVAEEAWNVAILQADAGKSGNMDVIFNTELASYGMDTTATVVLYVDGVLADAQLVGLMEDTPAMVEFNTWGIREYEEAKIYVEAADAIPADNEYRLFNKAQADYEVLLVSDEPAFFETALLVCDNISITTVASLDELDQGAQWVNGAVKENIPGSGYDLYIYDSTVPKQLPEDGAVWMICPDWVPKGVTFELGERITAEAYLQVAPDSGSDVFSAISREVAVDDVYINEYVEISSVLGLETIYTCNGSPVILAGECKNARAVVFAFPLDASNLALRIAFPALIYNMLNYSLCPALNANSFTVGEAVTLNKVNGAVLTSVRADIPETTVQHYARLPESFVAEVPGAYVVSNVMADETVENTKFFVQLPPAESNLAATGETLPEFEFAETEVNYEREVTWWFVLVLLLLIVVEWGLQYREQF